MINERLQFRILFRDALLRMIDLELLSTGGDAGKLLGQVAALLSAFGFTFLMVTAPKYIASGLSQSQLLAAAYAETNFLFATAMAAAGLFAALAWKAVLPDRRDCALLGVLPVRLRTVFLARVTAIAAAAGAVILALNIFPGLLYPLVGPPAGAGVAGALRGLAAYWLSMGLMGLFVCCALLAVQALSVLLLSHRLFLRFSGWIQLAAFFLILAAYFLRPPLPSHLTAHNLGIASALPSFWFYTLWLKWNGDTSPVLAPFAARALWGLASAAAIGSSDSRSPLIAAFAGLSSSPTLRPPTVRGPLPRLADFSPVACSQGPSTAPLCCSLREPCFAAASTGFCSQPMAASAWRSPWSMSRICCMAIPAVSGIRWEYTAPPAATGTRSTFHF